MEPVRAGDDAVVEAVFRALADPTRRAIVEALASGPRRAGELSAATSTSPPVTSRHLRVLLEAGIVADERPPDDARVRRFRLRPQSVAAARAWLDQQQALWDEQLASFRRHVGARDRAGGGTTP